jgi:hypothetical protein
MDADRSPERHDENFEYFFGAIKFMVITNWKEDASL